MSPPPLPTTLINFFVYSFTAQVCRLQQRKGYIAGEASGLAQDVLALKMSVHRKEQHLSPGESEKYSSLDV